MLMPFQILGIWLRAILSIALLVGAGYLLKQWYDHREIVIERRPIVVAETATKRSDTPQPGETTAIETTSVPWSFGWNRETAWLISGLALLIWSIGGGFSWPKVLRRSGEGAPKSIRGTGEIRRLKSDDGTELYVEIHGRTDGVPIVLTHGWGLDVDEWFYASKWADRYRLIVWDLPGLGESKSPGTKDWSVEKLARDLAKVVAIAGDRPVFLLGHSIGGMITLTFCKLFPQIRTERVAGVIIVHSTYTNPCRTAKWSGLYTALQRPVLEPLCWAMIALAPLFWLMNWVSYFNGSAHRSTSKSSFSGRETREQLGFLTRYYVWAWPSVVARGFLGMFRYDVSAALSTIDTPALIVAADRDELCDPSASRHMASAMPSARLEMIGDAKHCGLFERFQEFGKLVNGFVDEHSVPRPGRKSVPAATRR
jgi:pimeloyl-ACP methyl ester carboxylesterase